eukprot:1570831-Lingulodinium_polyedra.AAC.1
MPPARRGHVSRRVATQVAHATQRDPRGARATRAQNAIVGVRGRHREEIDAPPSMPISASVCPG